MPPLVNDGDARVAAHCYQDILIDDLKHQFQSKLYVSPSQARSSSRGSNHSSTAAVGAVALEKGEAGQPELRMVQHVERLRAELQLHSLAKDEVLSKGHIDLVSSWAIDRVLAQIAVRANRV